jgi:hypothetical protein
MSIKFEFGRNADRNLSKCLCDYCGTSYEVMYCKKFDERICRECVDDEEGQEDTLKAIKEEVDIHIEEGSLDPKKTFEEFYKDVDVIQAYEEEWDKEFYEEYYQLVWQDLQGNENTEQKPTN